MSGKEPSPIRRTNEHLFSEGNGDALVVVHGGPGMDFSYMKSSILTLSDSFRVILYEQRPLKSETLEKDFGAEDQVQDLVGLIGELSAESGDPVSLIAHSWGTYLALEALNSADSKSIGKVVLVNPLPLTWGRLVEAGGRLGGRVKPEHLEIVDRLERTGTEEAGFELMELVSYAYLAPANRGIVKPDVRRYNPLVNAQVTESVEDFDQRCSAVAVAGQHDIAVIHGDSDYIEASDTRELAQNTRQFVLADCGHFPFVEQPEALISAIRDHLNR